MLDIALAPDERLDEVNEKLTLIQKKDGLTFGTDAFLLAAFIKQQKYARAAELGAGTGIISLLCASREKLARIYALEIQKDFYDITCRNVEYNGYTDRVTPIHSDIRDIKAADVGGELDVVFTNPPFMTVDSGKRNQSDRKYIARHEVCGGIEDFCAAAYRLLKHGGRFYCVWRPDRLSSLMAAMKANRLEPKLMTFVHGDGETPSSMVLVSATKGGSEGMKLLPPLLLHESGSKTDGARAMTARAEKIYETMSFDEV